MADTQTVTRAQLIDKLNEDLSREYQAIIAYVVYSQVLKGAQYMSIAGELEKHASEELAHALTISKHIDYLGGMPTNTPRPVKLTDNAEECFAPICRMKATRFVLTASGCSSAKPSASTRSQKTSGRFSGRNRNI